MAAASSCWAIAKARDTANSRRDAQLQNQFSAPYLKINFHLKKCILEPDIKQEKLGIN